MHYRKIIAQLKDRLRKLCSAAAEHLPVILSWAFQKLIFLKNGLMHLFLTIREKGFHMPDRGDTEPEVPSGSSSQRKILISRCLYGDEEPVRYDGRRIPLENSILLRWKEENRLVPVCPEVDGGLSVPRPPSERSGRNVICLDGTDVTDAYREGSVHALQLARQHQVAFAVMKEKSPACGSSLIHDGHFNGTLIHGEGTTVEILRNAGIIVFSEKELTEAAEFLALLETEGGNGLKEEIPWRSGIMKGYKK